MSPPSKPAFRVVLPDGRKSAVYTRAEVVLGRHSSCELKLKTRGVSRRHAEIRLGELGWSVHDLGSTNGTFVNDERVTDRPLANGDEIRISGTKLRFDIVTAPRDRTLLESLVIYEAEATGGKREVLDAAKGPHWSVQLVQTAARALLGRGELDPVLETVMDLMFEHLPAERGLISLRDDESGEWRPRAVRDLDGERGEKLAISQSIAGTAVNERQSVLVSDTSEDDRFSGMQSILLSGIRSAMCAPLLVEDTVLGYVYVDSRGEDREFTRQHLEALTALASISAIAVEKTRLREDMARERAIRGNLERYSSPAIVDAIVSLSGTSTEGLVAESREMSVLFADLVGFTPLSEDMDPVEVANLLNDVFGRLTNAVFSYDGTLDKFMGDGLMALFGAPMEQEKHARNAVRAALLMQQQIAQLNETREGQRPLALRIGIHSGTAVAGDIGSPRRKDYTAIGDTVNTASRLEAYVAKAGQIAIGEETFRQVRDRIDCEDRGEVRLKGKDRPVRVYRVLGRKPRE